MQKRFAGNCCIQPVFLDTYIIGVLYNNNLKLDALRCSAIRAGGKPNQREGILMRRFFVAITTLIIFLLFASAGLTAAPFYQGKVFRVTVGVSAGWGF